MGISRPALGDGERHPLIYGKGSEYHQWAARLILLPSQFGCTYMVARAFRGRKSLETGTVRDSRGNRCGGKIKQSYVGRVLRLTLLAPDIVEAILDGRQPLAM